ncbi:LysR family transcriptional regulator [Seongchinamella sediminis]|uniref:LysR family transcriptional regulator n=1 Tax=Seongchinamella sediminis TaxID=2283635 RepID=A0A3L7E227_9GAMM|nr:LysR substrate-binding domain-containing protein [Seongchinamella sediminis]RLQ22760.1 LysR family transcriptional regulator [Seongchinamella sediminis]
MDITRRNLPLNALRAFEVAARHCHLRRAADELGVTHGAVSRQIRQLEAQLGTQLFDRSNNRLALTLEGRRLARAVSEALDRLTEGALSVDPTSLPGELVIAAPPSISACWLLAMIADFNRSYPEIEIRLDNINPLQQELPANVEVAVCFGEPRAPKKVVRELFRESYGPVLSPALLPPEGAVSEPRDLLRLPLIHDRHGRWQRWLANQGLRERDARSHIYVQDSYLGIAAARDGCGVFLADRIEVSSDLRNGSLVALGGPTVEARHSHYLVTDLPEAVSARARLFAEYLGRELGVPGSGSLSA